MQRTGFVKMFVTATSTVAMAIILVIAMTPIIRIISGRLFKIQS